MVTGPGGVGKRRLVETLVRSLLCPRPDADGGTGHDADNQVQDGSLQTLYEVVSSINTAHGLDDLLTRFLFTLKRITQAHAAIIWVSHKPGHVELAARRTFRPVQSESEAIRAVTRA